MREMEDKVLYGIMEKAVRENPERYVAVLENGETVLADSREDLFEIAKKRAGEIRCVSHGRSKYKHSIY
jgi:hypothetical protein